MSKVHEALRRAERERAAAGSLPRADGLAPEERAAAAPAAERPASAAPHDERGGEGSRPGHLAPPAPGEAPAAAAVPGPEAAGRTAEAAAVERQVRLDGARITADVRLAEGLVAFTRPRSLAAEQYRAIRTQLATFGRSVPIRTMVVTSPLSGEGKTTTAANLAIALSQEVGRRVCLVDCDLRSPQIHTLFGLAPREGLADVLRRRASLEAALVATPVNDLWLLTAGHLPPNPAELIGSPAMRGVVSSLREAFDAVVFDTPPVLPLPDPAILGGLADGIVLVVLAGKTPRRLIDRALDRLQGTMLLGFVLNNTDEFRHYAYYYYNYGA